MKKTESIRIAEIQSQTELAKAVLSNPVFELVGAVVLVEFLQRYPKSRPLIGNWQGNALELGIGGIITVQQLAPSLPYLTQAGTDIFKMLGPAIAAGA